MSTSLLPRFAEFLGCLPRIADSNSIGTLLDDDLEGLNAKWDGGRFLGVILAICRRRN